MTNSWRRELAELDETQQHRELTEREIIRWNDAIRKRAKEMSRSKPQPDIRPW